MLVPSRFESTFDVSGGLKYELELLSISRSSILLIQISPEPFVSDAESLQIVFDFDDVLKPEAKVINTMPHCRVSIERSQLFIGVSCVCLELDLSKRIGHV